MRGSDTLYAEPITHLGILTMQQALPMSHIIVLSDFIFVQLRRKRYLYDSAWSSIPALIRLLSL